MTLALQESSTPAPAPSSGHGKENLSHVCVPEMQHMQECAGSIASLTAAHRIARCRLSENDTDGRLLIIWSASGDRLFRVSDEDAEIRNAAVFVDEAKMLASCQ